MFFGVNSLIFSGYWVHYFFFFRTNILLNLKLAYLFVYLSVCSVCAQRLLLSYVFVSMGLHFVECKGDRFVN